MLNETSNPTDFKGIKIGLASASQMREWSKGEVKKPETINYRTLKPEKDGLFCERIFGPSKDWECNCGKYKKVRYKGVVCDRCGVEITKAKVRRERMGHIELAAPVSHIWYFKGIPSRMGLLLDMSPKALERVLYFASYVILDAGDTGLEVKQVLTEREYQEAVEKYGYGTFRGGMGAEAIKELLSEIDLDKEFEELNTSYPDATGQKRAKIIKRLEVVEAFRQSGNNPEWMIMDVVPVIPPDLRPMVQLDGGRFATSDLNDLYRRVINRNNRLKRLLDLGAPEIIVRNEKRMLQEAVDSLIDNGRRGRPVTGPGNRALKSLSDMLKGKQGRFRQNLLGKRVDYSGRSVIVVGPTLKFWQCGLPKKMALELFKPFVMRKLVEKEIAHNIKAAKRMIDREQSEVWDILEVVIKEHPVMLNRAPSLHRLSIQAFEPVLIEGKAIRLHPLVCSAFNADFDGDQMAVHVPLSAEAQAECRYLMLSTNNLIKPSNGEPIVTPSQDMILGLYYLSTKRDGLKGEGKVFKDENEAMMAYQNGEVEIQSKIKLRRTFENGENKIIDTTVGFIILNKEIPQDLGFVDRNDEEEKFRYEIEMQLTKGNLKKLLTKAINNKKSSEVVELLDYIKNLGYGYATVGGFTIAASDVIIPETKAGMIKEADDKVEKINALYRRGLMTEEERHMKICMMWAATTEAVTDELMGSLSEFNNVKMMAHSGARGSRNQIRQLAGMRGNMADTTGKTIELPIKASFKDGLNVLEYFISSHGARKGLSDTALRTADSGYLTRRLVDVSQDIIVREDDCMAGRNVKGMWISALKEGKEIVESFEERITGRTLAEAIVHPETGEVLAEVNELITPNKAAVIEAAGVENACIRTLLTCESKSGVCAKCYGFNMGRGTAVTVGESVGIVAAQSIGEPGTQLTMRTFHTGGIAGGDITQGLPRIEELFEARRPKGMAVITEIAGEVTLREEGKKREAIIRDTETGDTKTYLIPYGARLDKNIADGVMVEKAAKLTEGNINPHEMLAVKGIQGVQDYVLTEVQKVYRLQGVETNDKHIEIILRQMLKKIRIEEPGDTGFVPGAVMDYVEFERKNEEMEDQGLEIATGDRMLLGITKASLATESFLSAASFQETTRVLTEAAIKGKVDKLEGLKENVIIGNLIPAGTGLLKNKKFLYEREEQEETTEDVM